MLQVSTPNRFEGELKATVDTVSDYSILLTEVALRAGLNAVGYTGSRYSFRMLGEHSGDINRFESLF